MANAAFLNTLGDQSKSRHSKYLPYLRTEPPRSSHTARHDKMATEYDEQAMLSQSHFYSPAHLAQRNIRPGHLILIRRVSSFRQSSTLLLVVEVDSHSLDPLHGISVAIVPTSELPEHLIIHLLQIQDADDVLKSHHVRQALVSMAHQNGPIAPLAEHVNPNDRVFVRPTGGAVRKYLLNDQCPNRICQNGVCVRHVQIYDRFPALRNGILPNTLQLALEGIGGRRMLCPGCYGHAMVRRGERCAVAAGLISTGLRQPRSAILEEIVYIREMIRYVHQLELGYNLYNDPVPYAQTPIEPASVSSPTSSAVSSQPQSRLSRATEVSSIPQSTQAVEESLRLTSTSSRRTPDRSAHPSRRSTQEQLTSVSTSATGRTVGDTSHSGTSEHTPASQAARQRHRERREDHQSTEAQAGPGSNTRQPTSSTSTSASASTHRARTSTSGQQHAPPAERTPSRSNRSTSSNTQHPPVLASSSQPPAPTTIEELIRAPADPSTTMTTTSTRVQHPHPSTSILPILDDWQEIPSNPQLQWNILPTWTPIPSAWQQEWANLPEWEPIPRHIEEEQHQQQMTMMRDEAVISPTSRKALGRMAKSRYKNWRRKYWDQAGDDCPICLGGFGGGGGEDNSMRRDGGGGGDERYILTTSCQHHFHEDCVMDWFQTSNQCPICRRKMV